MVHVEECTVLDHLKSTKSKGGRVCRSTAITASPGDQFKDCGYVIQSIMFTETRGGVNVFRWNGDRCDDPFCECGGTNFAGDDPDTQAAIAHSAWQVPESQGPAMTLKELHQQCLERYSRVIEFRQDQSAIAAESTWLKAQGFLPDGEQANRERALATVGGVSWAVELRKNAGDVLKLSVMYDAGLDEWSMGYYEIRKKASNALAAILGSPLFDAIRISTTKKLDRRKVLTAIDLFK